MSVEALLRRERRLVIGALALVAAIAWLYTLSGAAVSAPMAEMAMQPMTWSPTVAALMFMMWWLMMIAMMLPSAAPMALLFAAINRRRNEPADAVRGTGIFVGGYLAAWAGFSLIATLAQWGLDEVGLLSGSMGIGNAELGGAILLAAGLYQFTPAKRVCLRHCQRPVVFISSHWHPGAGGAFRMGVEHGAYCLGCCWVLMTLLFFGGVMNVFWIAGLAVYVALEKLARFGHRLAAASGGLLAAWGVVVIIRAL